MRHRGTGAPRRPGWEFTRARGRLLEGSCLLELVVQAGRGARVSVSGAVAARVAGGLPGRFWAAPPAPLAFSGDI